MNIIRKIATVLLNIGALTIILTIIQPKPSVDTEFRIVAGVIIVVCLAVLFGLSAIERNKAKQQTSKDPNHSAHGGNA